MTDVVQKPDLGRSGAHKEGQEPMAATTPPYAGGAADGLYGGVVKVEKIRRAAARQWAVLMAIIVVVLVVSGVYRLHGIFGSQDQTSRPSADSPENTGFDPKRVHLQVLGDPGARATINFLDEHAQPQRVDDAPLPWSHELVTEDTTLLADVRAQGDSSSIACRITVNGIVKDERSSNEVNGYIACLDKTA
jgi:Mycobacterium membrane protein